MQFPINIELRRSRLLALLLVSAHTLAFFSILVLAWPWAPGWKAPLFLAIAFSLFRSLAADRVTHLRLLDKGALHWAEKDGEWRSAEVLPGTTVFAGLVVLRFSPAGGGSVISLTLLPDSMEAESFRALRVCLRWSTKRGVAHG